MTFILDPELNIINANQVALDRLGLSLAQIREKRCVDLFCGKECSGDCCPMRNPMPKKESVLSEMEIKAVGGVFLVKCTPIHDSKGNLTKIIHIATEITVRKKAEGALKKSEEKYRDLITNAMMGGVYQVKDHGEFIMANHRTVEMLGFTSVEGFFHKKRNIKDFYVDPGLREDFKKEIEATGFLKGGEAEFQKYNGERIWVKMNTRKIENEEGGICYEGLIQDITEMKQLEQRFLQSQRIEAIGTLAGGVAHDFNNILAPIIGYAELALEDSEKGSTIESDLMEILKASKRAKGLVKQILTFARQSKQQLAPIKAVTIAKEALKFLRSFLPRSIEIKQNFVSNSLIMGDATQIHQIFMNLFTNASQAMPKEIGTIEVKVQDTLLKEEFENGLNELIPGEYLQIIVSDTGKGIDPDHMTKIFEPYFTTKEREKGTGMGLAVVHGIVKSYGGAIMAKSELGKGTKITIFLPILEKEEEFFHIQDEKPKGGTERLMLVDDEIPILEMNQQILKRLGYQVETYTSGLDALERFQMAPDEIDLVITDMTMPKITGDLLSKELLKADPELPIILLTGYHKKISSQMAAQIGIKEKALKPLSKNDLAKMVRRVLDNAIST